MERAQRQLFICARAAGGYLKAESGQNLIANRQCPPKVKPSGQATGNSVSILPTEFCLLTVADRGEPLTSQEVVLLKKSAGKRRRQTRSIGHVRHPQAALWQNSGLSR